MPKGFANKSTKKRAIQDGYAKGKSLITLSLEHDVPVRMISDWLKEGAEDLGPLPRLTKQRLAYMIAGTDDPEVVVKLAYAASRYINVEETATDDLAEKVARFLASNTEAIDDDGSNGSTGGDDGGWVDGDVPGVDTEGDP